MRSRNLKWILTDMDLTGYISIDSIKIMKNSKIGSSMMKFSEQY